MATIEYWIQLENRPWDASPNNIDRMTGMNMKETTGKDPVDVQITSPGTLSDRLRSRTHTNTDQRFLPLKWAREGNCGLRITAPANAQLAPPGYYLLFILDDCGVPSMGRFIQLH